MRSITKTGLFLLILLTGMASLAAQKPLNPDQAFRISADMAGDDKVRVSWNIQDGYYLYADKFRFTTSTPGITLGDPQFPPPQTRNDPTFGEIPVYRGRIDVLLPIKRAAHAPDLLTLKVRTQGCLEQDPCYPPHTQTILVALRASADQPPPVDVSKLNELDVQGTPTTDSTETASPSPAPAASLPAATEAPTASNPLAELGALGDALGLGGGDDGLLSPEEAYQLNVEVVDGRTLRLHWNIADGTYLYQDKIKLSLQGDGVALGKYELPKPKIKHNLIRPDGSVGDVPIYVHGIDITVPLLRSITTATEVELTARYQGCAERGICYPPIKKKLKLTLPAVSAADSSEAVSSAAQQASEPAAASAAAPKVSEQDQIAGLLAGGNTFLIVASFFGIGLLLAFTPCVFPMIPILSGIIAGQGSSITARRGFLLSLVYVVAMAITYTIAGILVGLFSVNLSAALQHPAVLTVFAGVFVALALSMFGFYDLQLPASLQSKLTEISNRQKGGSYVGVAVMGLLSALIVGPCLAPPLAGALIFISQSQDAVLGGTALFAMGMGMGTPLLLIGASAGNLLPRAGAWMDAVKAVFGVMMLGIAIYLLERLVPTYLPPMVPMLLWGMLLMISGVYMGALRQLPMEYTGWPTLWKGVGVVILVYGALFLVGAAAGGKDTLQPLRGIAVASGGGGTAAATHPTFKHIKSVADLERELAAAKAAGKLVMLDFYADWCIYCKEMEAKTFPDPRVAALMKQMVLLQADVTRQDDDDKALQQRVQIPAPPAMIFWDRNGNEVKSYRLLGFMGPDEFSAHLQGVMQ